MNWVRYVSVRSTWGYDLGFYHNSAFNYAHGRWFHYVFTRAFFNDLDHNGPSVFRATHFSPIHSFVLFQLYAVRPHIVTLFLLQSLIIGFGAFPLYQFVTQQTGQRRLGLLVAFSYLLHPAILQIAFNDFLPIQLGIPFALFALWFHATKRLIPFLLAALLMLACREEYLFLVAAFGLINLRYLPPGKERLRWVLVPVLLASLWAGVASAYYLYFYGQICPCVTTASVIGGLRRRIGFVIDRVLGFFRTTLLPGVAGLLIPEAMIVALLFMARTSTRWPAFPQYKLHQLSPAIAVVFWAFACAVVRLWPRLAESRRRGAWAQGALLAAALLGFAHFSWGAARAYLVGGVPRYEAITRLDDALPADATVMVPKPLVARFSGHPRVFTYEALPVGTPTRPSEEEVRATVAELISICDLVATGREPWLDALVEQSGRYLPAQRTPRFHFYVANPGARRPADPDARLQQILRWGELSATKRRWAGLGVAR
jgi:hypothetical protein